jgi:hypothetical protein
MSPDRQAIAMTLKPLSHDLCIHICTISAGMVGVCLTGISLMRVFIGMNKVDTLADDLLCVNAVLFLLATLASYWTLRIRHERRRHWLERMADTAFICGVLMMTANCLYITYMFGRI